METTLWDSFPIPFLWKLQFHRRPFRQVDTHTLKQGLSTFLCRDLKNRTSNINVRKPDTNIINYNTVANPYSLTIYSRDSILYHYTCNTTAFALIVLMIQMNNAETSIITCSRIVKLFYRGYWALCFCLGWWIHQG